MTNQISVFQFQSSYEVRIQLINNEPWFCLKDVCDVLDIKNSSDLLSKQLDRAGVEKIYLRSGGQNRQLSFVNEPNLYRVIFRSNKPEARQFQDCVFNDVLPTIRKTGSYSVVESLPTINAKELQALKDIIHSISHSFWHKEAFTQGIWKAVRDITGVDTVQNVKRSQLPLLKSEFERMLNIVKVYMDLRRDTEREIVKKLFREQGNQDIVLWNIKHQHAQFLAHINDSYSGGMDKFHRILLSNLSDNNQLNLV